MAPATRLYGNGRNTTPHVRYEGTLSQTIWCKCGKPVVFSNETRCEDCYADDAELFTGRPTRLNVPEKSERELQEQQARSDQVIGWFDKGNRK